MANKQANELMNLCCKDLSRIAGFLVLSADMTMEAEGNLDKASEVSQMKHCDMHKQLTRELKSKIEQLYIKIHCCLEHINDPALAKMIERGSLLRSEDLGMSENEQS